MVKAAEQMFFQRRHTNSQQVCEKVLKITHHQRNGNQRHNEISPYTYKDASYQKRQEITNPDKNVEKGEWSLLHC